MPSISNLIWIVYLINFAVLVTIVCFQKRNPIESMAWVMCFLLLPVFGGIIFLIFGVGVNTLTKKKYKQKLEMNEKYLLERQKATIGRDLERPESDIVNYFLNYNFIYTENNDVKIFTDANEKYKQLMEDIENARESIDILYFIIHNDNIGNRLIKLLIKKANEGIKVRLMYDGCGSFFTPKKFFNELRNAPNSEVVEFFPVKVFSPSKINHRNHRKIAIIDGKTAYLGGMNIGDEYANKAKNRPFWRDTHIRIEGEAVEFAFRIFAMDWEFSTGEHIEVKNLLGNIKSKEIIPMQIVSSGPDSKAEEIKCGMMKMINSAKKYVYIQTPYFIPDATFLTCIEMAVKSGVDVRIMIPGIPDKKYVYCTTMSYIGELLDLGVKVYLYPGFIHSKTITVDDKLLTIGSANTDIRSFKLLFEINAFIYSEKTAEEHRKIFEEDVKNCTVLTEEKYENRGIIKIITEGIFRLFSPIM